MDLRDASFQTRVIRVNPRLIVGVLTQSGGDNITVVATPLNASQVRYVAHITTILQPRRPSNLSTHVEPEIETSADVPNAQPISLAGLVAAINAQQGRPRLEQIYAWLENAEISREELQPYLGFKEGNYWRHRVCRNDFAEMLVLCWRPGHRTPIHDHNGSHGVVKVYDGVMWETIFVFDNEKGLCYKSGRERAQGEVTGSDVPDIHQLGNPEVSGQDLITIHIYAPPLGVLKTYQVGSPEIDLYTPDDSQS